MLTLKLHSLRLERLFRISNEFQPYVYLDTHKSTLFRENASAR